MWNVSESTVKRWTDNGELRCYRTPGGHRKFRLEDISAFQSKRGFEATGLLSSDAWEDPDIEVCVNQKRFDRVRRLILYLAKHNQRLRIKELLERLYIRGIGIVEIYDEVLSPVSEEAEKALDCADLTVGQSRLVTNNLEEAMYWLFPFIVRRRKNGKMALCASTAEAARMPVNAVCRILEVEGWEALNLGERIPCQAIADMVKQEPVNLVCLICARSPDRRQLKEYEELYGVADEYRIPVVLGGVGVADPKTRQALPHDEYFSNFRSFRRFLARLNH